MQKPAIHILTSLVGVTTCLLLTQAVRPIPLAAARRLPVETFPRQIGEWRATTSLAEAPEMKDMLATSVVLERLYTDTDGAQVDVVLVTAQDATDIHSPVSCFPAQGWTLTRPRPLRVEETTIQTTSANLDGEHMSLWFWKCGYYPPVLHARLPARMRAVRDRLMGHDDQMSLLVRLMAPNTAQGNAALARFSQAALPPLHHLTGS